MAQADIMNDGESGLSLATVATGIAIAALFLLVSSYVSKDSAWTSPSSRVFATTSLAVDDIAIAGVPFEMDQGLNLKTTVQHEETGHLLDALYSADFMRISTEAI